ncbi:MBL fold metallo-hydrolase [Segetibacter sp. 3557_3]|uniref:MBL fold metallo-hydrolase n=1 Tax=Segetibacter sp. 3557_3 TaxID=2547429 RepID=UPI0010587640|nr:MBL fold metallo-hydrolase [Segetibacter sp. 3557_3]TDH19829.1 MBL fold metallo-hydrolase [Segetibacter sp. 3557_3]
MSYPPINITFLGTGTSSGVPMVGCDCEVCTSTDSKDTRLRSSILVSSATTTIVVDATPDFRYQMLRERIKSIDAVLITHPHKDHIAGIDDTRPFQFFQRLPTQVYGNKLSITGIKNEIPYAFEAIRYPGVPAITLHEITLTPFYIGDLYIVPILVWHHKMPVYGFRFGKFTYITDANKIDEAEKDKIRGSEVVVLNALRNESHISHFTLNEAVEMVHELGVKRAYFTHISHQLGRHSNVMDNLPDGIGLAYDRLKISV